MAIVIGIDPGSRVTGFGVLEIQGNAVRHVSHGIIRLPEEKELSQRLAVLAQSFRELFTRYKPSEVVIEKVFLGKNPDSAFKLGHARGVAMAESALAGAIVYEYATRLIKKGVAGKGSAGKEEVQLMIQRLLQLPKIDHLDASDALALAYYHSSQRQVLRRVERAKMREGELL
ncbi:MAG: crossover junction endodeoxyribonuclease RuvC [Oligoflexia bacterium]|nr:MAG: crossover junction endodeoxyribonuclease RuvC [Oligoflexia bacterium]